MKGVVIFLVGLMSLMLVGCQTSPASEAQNFGECYRCALDGSDSIEILLNQSFCPEGYVSSQPNCQNPDTQFDCFKCEGGIIQQLSGQVECPEDYVKEKPLRC